MLGMGGMTQLYITSGFARMDVDITLRIKDIASIDWDSEFYFHANSCHSPCFANSEMSYNRFP